MKRLINFGILFMAVCVFSQGGFSQAGANDFICLTNNVPISFKINTYSAGFTGSSTNSNVSFGYQALNNPLSGYGNTANGFYALRSNTTGGGNTANGAEALYSNGTGSSNTATGGLALKNNMNGSDNTATGNNALCYNVNGGNNTATGSLALSYNAGGNNNTAVGYCALYDNVSGSSNTAIGCYANVNASNLSNATALGNYAIVMASNQVRIGNSSVNSIGGYAGWTNFSDGRAKKNVKQDVPGLDFIKLLQPVTYNLDMDVIDDLLKIDKSKENLDPQGQPLPRELIDINDRARKSKEKQVQTGFIAQDVEATAKSIGYDFSGVDAPENGEGPYGLRYAEFVVPLVKAVQELSGQNDRLQEQVNELTGLVYKLLEAAPGLRSENSEAALTGLAEASTGGASLLQNIPNPFSETTVIRYTLPQTCNSAQIVLATSTGNVVRQTPLSVSEKSGSITIEGGVLSPGICFYSLYVDSKLIDTKKMIITK